MFIDKNNYIMILLFWKILNRENIDFFDYKNNNNGITNDRPWDFMEFMLFMEIIKILKKIESNILWKSKNGDHVFLIVEKWYGIRGRCISKMMGRKRFIKYKKR